MPISLDRQYSFDNFLTDDGRLIIENLQALIDARGETQIGLWGGAASGKTHLLNASADYARRRGIVMQLYDGLQLRHCDADAFDGLDHGDLLAVDNLDALAGNRAWETVFYRVINRCREGHGRFLFSMASRPHELEVSLDDFRSRLQWGLLLQLPVSSDNDVRRILRRRADLLGFDLSDEVISYLLRHHPRDLAEQISILRRLDGASLTAHRRVTIPLVKQALAEKSD